MGVGVICSASFGIHGYGIVKQDRDVMPTRPGSRAGYEYVPRPTGAGLGGGGPSVYGSHMGGHTRKFRARIGQRVTSEKEADSMEWYDVRVMIVLRRAKQ